MKARGRPGRWAGALLLCALTLPFQACQKEEPQEDYFAQGEYLLLEGKYEEAARALKQHMLSHPYDPGAHFYLGRAYLYQVEKPYIRLAKGEFEIALDQIDRQQTENPIARFETDGYFRFICNIELSKIYLRLIAMTLENNAPAAVADTFARRAEEYYDQAKALRPDAGEVEQLRQLLKETFVMLNRRPGVPRVETTA